MEQEKNNTSKIVVILTVVLALIFIPTGFVLGKLVAENEALKSNISSNEDKDSSEKDKVEASKDSNESEEKNNSNDGNSISDNSTKVCSGFIDAVYEGGYQSGDLDEYLTLTLSKDGNVVETYRNSEAPTGTYTIKDNKLTISLCPTYGPCDEKIVTTYDITSDCSTIKWGEADSHQYNINRK